MKTKGSPAKVCETCGAIDEDDVFDPDCIACVVLQYANEKSDKKEAMLIGLFIGLQKTASGMAQSAIDLMCPHHVWQQRHIEKAGA
jgi:hypothetical protein